MKDATTSKASCKTTDNLWPGDVFRYPGGDGCVWVHTCGMWEAVCLVGPGAGAVQPLPHGRAVEILEDAEIRGRWR